MKQILEKNIKTDIKEHLKNFVFADNVNLFDAGKKSKQDFVVANNLRIPRFINEFWTSKQRQANSLHEISYRACFKPQLPNFFIKLFTNEKDIVYDPFSGRGTTVIEAALLDRNIIANDINPLSIILSKPRLFIIDMIELKQRLNEIKIDKNLKSEIDLSMFYHQQTLLEILSIKKYLKQRKENGLEDTLDAWIRMVATNRLTGHSKGFFSVYTLPPNQAVSPESQIKINENKKQTPEYRDTKEIILIKTKDLLRDITQQQKYVLHNVASHALFLNKDARNTFEIKSNSVKLTVTSPPFLDVVQYTDDNWLRCWFNDIDIKEMSKNITICKKIEDWCKIMCDVFKELFRITKSDGWIAFEVGEVKNGKVKLDEYVAAIGINAGFACECIMINEQTFTKTANIWGIKNNEGGTNSNRVVILRKR